MNAIPVIIGLTSAALTSFFSEKVCDLIGKPEYSQYVRVGGYTVAGTTVMAATIQFIAELWKFAAKH